MARTEQRHDNPGDASGVDPVVPEVRQRPAIKRARLNGITHAQLRALGNGSEVMGAVRYLEEVGRLFEEGEITPDTRPLGEELDRLGPSVITSFGDKTIN